MKFYYYSNCVKAIEELKKRLVEAPILITPNWDLPFELKSNASDIVVGFYQDKVKTSSSIWLTMPPRLLMLLKWIYYDRERDIVINVCFWQFLVLLCGKSYWVHKVLYYPLVIQKGRKKPNFIQWILLLHEFDIEIKDR